jgi:Predicted oxidoreductases (related to aryl-alcohol dehydrogenases)
MMNKRQLGKTGINISELAFGCVEIGIPYGIGVESEKDLLPEEEAILLLRKALSSGVNFFDTARMYGASERILGMAFKDMRDDVVIASKCVHLLGQDGHLPAGNKVRDIIEKSLTDSLTALQTDYIDLYMLHQANIEILESDIIQKAFSDFKSQGLIRATGVSSYSNEVSHKAITSGFWDMVQVPFNLLDQRQGELFGVARENGIGIVIRSVLMKGLLSERGRNLHPALKDVEKHIGKYREMLEGTEYSLPAFATKFALSFPEVSSVLVGIDKQQYLEEALETVDGDYLGGDMLERAKQLSYPDPAFLNLPYWDKMNWLR